ncbi:sensor histidine kinase, partial [Streptomyces cavourensis]
MTGAGIAVLAVLVALLFGAGFLLGRRTARPLRPSDVGTPVEHATFETLHTASLAAPPLRAGLTEESARRSARRLRSLLGTDALCLTDRERVLVWDGAGHHHGKDVLGHIEELLEGGRGTAF